MVLAPCLMCLQVGKTFVRTKKGRAQIVFYYENIPTLVPLIRQNWCLLKRQTTRVLFEELGCCESSMEVYVRGSIPTLECQIAGYEFCIAIGQT